MSQLRAGVPQVDVDGNAMPNRGPQFSGTKIPVAWTKSPVFISLALAGLVLWAVWPSRKAASSSDSELVDDAGWDEPFGDPAYADEDYAGALADRHAGFTDSATDLRELLPLGDLEQGAAECGYRDGLVRKRLVSSKSGN